MSCDVQGAVPVPPPFGVMYAAIAATGTVTGAISSAAGRLRRRFASFVVLARRDGIAFSPDASSVKLGDDRRPPRFESGAACATRGAIGAFCCPGRGNDGGGLTRGGDGAPGRAAAGGGGGGGAFDVVVITGGGGGAGIAGATRGGGLRPAARGGATSAAAFP